MLRRAQCSFSWWDFGVNEYFGQLRSSIPSSLWALVWRYFDIRWVLRSIEVEHSIERNGPLHDVYFGVNEHLNHVRSRTPSSLWTLTWLSVSNYTLDSFEIGCSLLYQKVPAWPSTIGVKVYATKVHFLLNCCSSSSTWISPYSICSDVAHMHETLDIIVVQLACYRVMT